MTLMHDLYNNLDARRALSPVATAVADDTAQQSQIIDMQGWQTCIFYIATGTLADSDATFAVLVEDGDDSGLSDNAAVADAFLDPTEAITGFDFADDDQVRRIMYKGPKRYVRLTITPSGNGSAAPLAAIAIMGGPSVAPVTEQAT